MKLQVFAGLLSTAQGEKISEITHGIIFDGVPAEFWKQDYVKDLVKIKFPKSSEKWISNKAGHLDKLAEKTKRAFDRCGQENS